MGSTHPLQAQTGLCPALPPLGLVLLAQKRGASQMNAAMRSLQAQRTVPTYQMNQEWAERWSDPTRHCCLSTTQPRLQHTIWTWTRAAFPPCPICCSSNALPQVSI